MTTPELLEFIRIEHALGMPLSEISRLLLLEGEWDPEDIAEAFTALGLPTEAINGEEKAAVISQVPALESQVEAAPVFEVSPQVEAIQDAVSISESEATPVAQVAPVEQLPETPHPFTEAPVVMTPPVISRMERATNAEEIFASGPVVAPFDIGEAVEPTQSPELLAQMKSEEGRIASAKAEEEARSLASKQAEAADLAKTTEEATKSAEVTARDEEAKKADAEIQAKIAAEKEATLKDDQEEKSEAEAAQREAAEKKARIEVEARMKAEDEARIKIEAEMKVRAEMAAKQAVAGMAPIIQAGVMGTPVQMAPQMAGQIPQVIYAAQMVAAPALVQPAKPTEPLSPMRATTSAKSISTPTAPIAPAPIKFDISKVRIPETKPGMPGQPSSMVGALAGMQPVKSMTPEDFFKAQAAGEGMGESEGVAIARSLKVPHKRTMFGDMERMQQGTLPAQVSGSAVDQQMGAEGTPAVFGQTAAEGALRGGPTGATLGSSSENAVLADKATQKTSSSSLAVFLIALLFLIVSGALAGYYYYFYRLPTDANALLAQSIATTLAPGNEIAYTLGFTAKLNKEGGELLSADVRSSGIALTTQDGIGDSEHNKVAVSIEQSGVSDPISLHFTGDFKNVDGKYYFKSDQGAGTSDVLSRAAGSWVTAVPAEIGAVIGLASTASLASSPIDIPSTPVSTFYAAVKSHTPWRQLGTVERGGAQPIYLAPDEYRVQIALDPKNLIDLTDSMSYIFRGQDSAKTSDDRRAQLATRYNFAHGYAVIDRKTLRLRSIDFSVNYDSSSSGIGGNALFSLKITYPTSVTKILAPAGSRTVGDILGVNNETGVEVATSSPAVSTSTAEVVPVSTTTIPVKNTTKNPVK